MKHQSRRSRHNGNGNGKRPSRTKVFDSNGPDVRIRGTAFQVNEKYLTLAKDADSSGDHIMAESYRQHAEHYQRLINSFDEDAPAQQNRRQQQQTNKPVESESVGVDADVKDEAKEKDLVAA